MISILKSKFAVLGFVFVAVLLIPTISNAYAIIEGDGTHHADVYDYPFNVTILEGGSITLHNTGEQSIIFTMYSTGWDGTIPPNDAIAREFPITNCGNMTCYFEGTYIITDLNGGSQSTVTIVKPDTTPPVITFHSAIANGVVLPYPAPNFVDNDIFTWLEASTIVSDDVAIDTSLGLPIFNNAYSSHGLNCDKEYLWNINHSSWQQFPNGDTTITCKAWDTSGNEATASFTVTMNYVAPADTTPPVITVPTGMTVISAESYDSSNNALSYQDFKKSQLIFVPNWPPTAVDDTDGAITTRSDGFFLNSQSNNGEPSFGCEGLNANSISPDTFWILSHAANSSTYQSPPTFGVGPGVYPVFCYAMDSAGNRSESTFYITVIEDTPADTTPPTIDFRISSGYHPTNLSGNENLMQMIHWFFLNLMGIILLEKMILQHGFTPQMKKDSCLNGIFN